MRVFERIKNKLKLAKSRATGKRYVAIQKPVADMEYKEASKEFYKKEKIIFANEGSFNGRNKELVKKVIFQSKDNDLAIGYFTRMLNNNDVPKGVKYEFINNFCDLYDDNELLKILSIDERIINNQFKIQIVRKCIDKVPEEMLIQYYDYANFQISYVRKILENVSVDGKIIILNRIKNDKIREKLMLEEVKKLEFDDAKRLLEEVILYGYKEIQDFYINEIKSSDKEKVLNLLNGFRYISPDLAEELDKVIEPMDVDEVIEYINNNEVRSGGIIYLTRKFDFATKKKIFDNIKSLDTRKASLVIFTEDIEKEDFINMVKDEESAEIKVELINNMDKLLKEKEEFFKSMDIDELSDLCTIWG